MHWSQQQLMLVITTNDILKAADWSWDSVFKRFYYCPVNDPSFGRSWSVLALGTTWASCTCSTSSKKPFANYKQHHWYVRLSLLKYNFQMAQIMQWLHAIWNYMKKVKSSISMVPPTHPIYGLLSKSQSVTMWMCIKGIFYTCACCFWYTSHLYRPTNCRCLKLGQTSLICLTSPSSYNSMQSLHDLSHLEMLAYLLFYFSFSVFSWEYWSTLLLNTNSTIPIIKIILVFPALLFM